MLKYRQIQNDLQVQKSKKTYIQRRKSVYLCWQRMPSGNTIDISCTWYVGDIEDPDFQPGVYPVRMNLPLSAALGSSESREDCILVFLSVDGNAIRVFFNGQYIGSQGDFAHGNSNIRYAAKFFTVSAEQFTADPGHRLFYDWFFLTDFMILIISSPWFAVNTVCEQAPEKITLG